MGDSWFCHEYVWYKRPEIRDGSFGVGFGCPRVVWGSVPRENERRKNFFVIRNLDDLVTHLPPTLFGYRHVGNIVEIGNASNYSMIDAHRSENYITELEKTLN